jgi:hypothetical protein
MSVAATGADDAWATGQAFGFQCDRPGLLVARWDGKSWRELTPPPGFGGASRDAMGISVAALSASYAWAFAIRDAPPYLYDGFALLWRDGRWRTFRLPGSYAYVNSAAVFSRSNAWALGFKGRSGSRFALRFNGMRWRQVPVPVNPSDAAFPGPRNIWVAGATPSPRSSLALAHWTGRWRTIAFPTDLVPGGNITDVQVVSDGSRGAWVAVSTLSVSSVGVKVTGGALLHWTGSRWQSIKVPFPTGGFGPLSHDGHGGLWIASSNSTDTTGGVCPACDINAMFHYNGGTWSRTLIHVPGLIVTAMRLIPGTASVWASGTNVPVPRGQGDAVGVMLKYGP